MTGAATGNAAETFTALWRRAPIWRLFFLMAALLTLLFTLFPPLPNASELPPSARQDVATYQPHAPPLQPTAPTARVAASVPAEPSKPQKASPPVAPKTAALAMVTPGPLQAPNESGLDAALLGPSYHGSVTIDGFTVPLPPGTWVNLAHSTINEQAATGDAHFLGKIRNRRLIGAMRIFTARSKAQPGAGFNEVKSCTEVNPGRTFVSIDDAIVPHGHQSCWTIRDIYATPWSLWADRAVKLSSLDRAAAGDMAAKGVTYPQDFIALTFTRTETWGLLEVGYLFSPEADGITSNIVLAVTETDWTPANIHRYPEKVAYIDKLKTWGSSFWPRFKASFDAAMPPGGAGAMP